MLGYTPNQIEASYASLLNFIHPNDIEIFQNELEKHINTKKSFELELQIETKKMDTNGLRSMLKHNGIVMVR